MSVNPNARPRILFAGGAAIAAGVAVFLAVGLGGASADNKQASSTSATRATAAAAAPAAGKAVNPNLYPFGMPSGGVAIKVPAPASEPTLSPTYTTKTTTR